jgi:ketosteroid isomerase-like protein
MSSHADLITKLIDGWNAGDIDGVFELYHEDAVMRTGPHWPEQVTYRGREEIRATSADWASLWEALQVEIDTFEEFGDRVVATGAWRMRGVASGVGGEMPIFIMFTVREGKIAAVEWFEDHDTAVAAANGD